MKRDELRRLAIRLAYHSDRDGQNFCGKCEVEFGPYDSLAHTPDCPIAELEAEEKASHEP